MIIFSNTILFQNIGLASTYELQIEKDYLNNYNEFLQILDFDKLF